MHIVVDNFRIRERQMEKGTVHMYVHLLLQKIQKLVDKVDLPRLEPVRRIVQ